MFTMLTDWCSSYLKGNLQQVFFVPLHQQKGVTIYLLHKEQRRLSIQFGAVGMSELYHHAVLFVLPVEID
jgi:hypothetical protein